MPGGGGLTQLNELTASIVIVGSPEAKPEHLKRAIEHMLAQATRFPPDHRFDWSNCYVQAEKGK